MRAVVRSHSMLTTIIKRDGREVPFNLEKISNAIFKALQAAGNPNSDLALKLAVKASTLAEEHSVSANARPTVEEIQDTVERALIEADLADAAKRYILYRAERTRAREMNTRLMRTYEEITHSTSIDSDLKRDNANIDGDTAMGTMLKYGSEGAKIFNEMYVLKPEHAAAHKSGDIHIHDFDFYTLTTTCCQIDISKLFEGGFSTGHGFLREPNSITSYAALACIAIQSNQNDQHGGQSISSFDYALAEGVRKTRAKRYRVNLKKAHELLGDGPEHAAACEDFANKQAEIETETETFQAMEALIHNLNTMHSRAGAQVPFSSINYGTDTSPEGRMVIRNVLLATEAGLGFGETPIFPIQIFKVKDGVSANPGDPNYDLFQLACSVSTKRMFPNFSFLDAPFNAQYYKPGQIETEAAYMGCRTRVVGNKYDPSREIVSGRGNLSYTSVNLPRLAVLSGGNIDEFYRRLNELMDLVIDQLSDRFEIQCRKKARNFPFMMGNGIWLDSEKLGPDDEVREVLRHGTLTLGFIGLAETLKSLTGKHHGESEESQKLGLEIIGRMRKRMDDEGDRRGLNFTLIATPAEGLSGRFVEIDRKRFGSIDGVTDRKYYTNSFHVPVYYKLSAFDKIRLEAPYHALTNGGHITYVELDGDPASNPEAFEAIVRSMKQQGIGYGSVNHPLDRDPVCKYSGIIGDTCPRCGRKESDGPSFERIRRITGYLVGTLDKFNNAKRSEVSDRVRHMSMHDAR